MSELVDMWELFHPHCRHRECDGYNASLCSHDSNHNYEYEKDGYCCFEDCPLLDQADKDGEK